MDPHVEIAKIGTFAYPLGHPKYKRHFEAGSGKRIEDENLAALVRTIHRRTPFDFGQCYTNVETICKNAYPNGWKKEAVVPYAGWLIFESGRDRPCHHAWVVYERQQVIDMGQIYISTTLNDTMLKEWDAKGKEYEKRGALFEFNILWRDAWCRMLKPYEDGDVVENRIWGVVPPKVHYVGCPCDPTEAAKIYARWWKTQGKGLEGEEEPPGEMSAAQYISKLIGEGKTPEEILKLCEEKYRGTTEEGEGTQGPVDG